MDEVAVQIASLTTHVADLIRWMRVFTGVTVFGVFLVLAVLHRVIRIERDHGPVIRRLSAEQRARASHERTVAARRASRSDNDQPPH